MMKTTKTKLLFLLLALVIPGSQLFAQLPFLEQSGTLIVESTTGTPFFLKGTNLGNWFLQEGFMTSHSAHIYKTQSDIKRFLKDEGATEAQIEDFYSQWRGNFIKEADIEYIQSKGMNCVRVPLHYELFIPPAVRAKRREVIYATNTQQRETKYMAYKNALDNWANDSNYQVDYGLIGYYYLDNLIDWCNDNDLYLILDMHAVPGTQGAKEDIADRIHSDLPAKDLYHSQVNQDVLARIWDDISDRYKNESTIAMYELINEPNGLTNSEVQTLQGIYSDLIDRIRSNNDDHLILLQGNEYGNNYNYLEPTKFTASQRQNLVYSIHRYSTGSYYLPPTTHSIDSNENHISNLGNANVFRDKYKVPIFCGETGLNDDYDWAEDNIKALNKVGIGWTIWTYKHHRDGTQNGGGGLRCMAKIPGPWISAGPSAFSDIIQNIQFANIEENPNAAYWEGIHSPTSTIPSNLIITLKGAENHYVSGENGQQSMRCNRNEALAYEKFRVLYASGNSVHLKALSNNQYTAGAYVSSEDGSLNGMSANRGGAGSWETFTWESDGPNRVRLKGNNGKYVSLREDGKSAGNPMVCDRSNASAWETFTWEISTHPDAPLHGARVADEMTPASPTEEYGITLFPNPTGENFRILLKGYPKEEPVLVKIQGIDGKIVYQKKHYLSQDEEFHCEYLPDGVYMVFIEQDDTEIFREKLVIGK